jgi:hypothetical protein
MSRTHLLTLNLPIVQARLVNNPELVVLLRSAIGSDVDIDDPTEPIVDVVHHMTGEAAHEHDTEWRDQ